MVLIIPGHMTEEASRGIGIALAILAVAVITLAVFAVWGLVLLMRFLRRRDVTRPESNRREE